jgi:hypothetical protein
VANAALVERVKLLEAALRPFLMVNSSDEKFMLQVRSEWIKRGRALMTRCDGNHGAPACADPDCWLSEEPVVMHPLRQAVWPYEASAQHGQPVESDTPPWMQGMAHNIAVEYMREGQQRDDMERDIVNAMKEAAREVALYFAANPDGIKGHVIAKCVNDLRDIAVEFHASQQLRERISHRIHEFLGSKP